MRKIKIDDVNHLKVVYDELAEMFVKTGDIPRRINWDQEISVEWPNGLVVSYDFAGHWTGLTFTDDGRLYIMNMAVSDAKRSLWVSRPESYGLWAGGYMVRFGSTGLVKISTSGTDETRWVTSIAYGVVKA